MVVALEEDLRSQTDPGPGGYLPRPMAPLGSIASSVASAVSAGADGRVPLPTTRMDPPPCPIELPPLTTSPHPSLGLFPTLSLPKAHLAHQRKVPMGNEAYES